jgi:hypothetical protein
MDVIGGKYVPKRDNVLVDEVLFMTYFSRWFEIFAKSGDTIATPADSGKRLHICFGFYNGGNALTIPYSDTQYQLARGIADFAKNALPNTLDYLEEYAVMSHEFGHMLLALHKKSRSGPNGQSDKFEELRADCIAGYMMGTVIPGGFMDPRRERVAAAFVKAGSSGGPYSHGTWKERSDSARDAFIYGSLRMDKKTRIVLKSEDLVNYCVTKFPGN